MQIFAQQLPKRDSPGVATRQAGSKVADLFPCHYKIANIMISENYHYVLKEDKQEWLHEILFLPAKE